jgi:hypothetical protein
MDGSELTVVAEKMCSRPRYLCRKSRTGLAERLATVAASARAAAGVILGT